MRPSPAGVTRAEGERSADRRLSWLTGILWRDGGPARATVNGAAPARFRPAESYGVLPRAGEPRLLIPLTSRRAAAASLRQSNNSMTQPDRLKRWVASVGARVGIVQHLVADRLTVAMPAGPGRIERSTPSFRTHLQQRLGLEDLHLAILPGQARRPNGKPVLVLLTGRGAVVGFAKVGWNELTRGLIRNEARVLLEWASRPPRSFAVPRVLDEDRWGPLHFVVTSPAPARLWRRGRLNALPAARVAREVAGLGGVVRCRLRQSGYWNASRDRARSIGAGRPTGPAVLEAMRRLEAECGDEVLAFGTSHGDWAPWNMESTSQGPFIWDWERCRDGVPIGLDIVHFLVQPALRRSGVPAAIGRGLRQAPRNLAGIGVEPRLAPLLHRLHLIELVLRYEEGGDALETRARDVMTADVLRCLEASW